VERRTRYTVRIQDGTPVLRARSECAASALVLPLEDVDLDRTPRLRWRWRVDEDVAPEAPLTKQGDDFAARVYVMFPFDPGRASVWQRLQRRLAQALYGESLPGEALSYVWSEQIPAGESWPNPYAEQSRMISLGAGPPGQWVEAQVDVRADYAAHFGAAVPDPMALGVMSDSDNSCGSATAWFAGFELRGS
jgi:hypothetical protein